MGIFDFLKKKKKQETITVTNLPPQTKPSVTFVDVGRQAPTGQQFVDSSGKSQGTFVRTGGYTIVGGRSAGGGGGSPNNIVSTSGEVTPQQAYAFEGGKTVSIPSSTTKPQNINISKDVLAKIEQDKRNQAAYARKTTAQDYGSISKKPTQEVFTSSYITRKNPSVSGYTKSGKPIYKEGEAIVVNPFSEQTPEFYRFGGVKERPATQEEITLIPTNLPNINYNIEDYSSYKDLFKMNRSEAIVRKVGYDIGQFVTAAWKVPYQKITGYKVPESISAKSRTIIGESALFVGFSPTFTTTAQYYKAINTPAKVKFKGTYQQSDKGLTKTETYFEATKGGTTYRGKAIGISESTPVNVGNKEYIKIFGQAKGIAAQRALNIPKGLTYVNQQAFVTQESGVGVAEGNLFKSVTKGALGSSKGYSFKYLSAGVQATGTKGITVTAGGTLSPYGSSKFAGFLFPLKEKVIQFVPFAAKRGSIGMLTPTVPTYTLGEQASLAVTRSSVQAFATTIPVSSVGIGITPTFSLTKLYPDYQKEIIKPSFMLKEKEVSVISSGYGLVSLPKQEAAQQTRQRSISSSALISPQITETKTKQVQILQQKQVQKQKQIFKYNFPKQTFGEPRIQTPKIYIPNIKFGTGIQTSKGGSFVVSVRRFGKFKPMGIFGTQKKAFSFGKFKTSKTLAATFKVSGRGVKQPQNIFGFRRKKSKKEGIVFIEQPRFRLSTPTEKSEIFSYRRQKGGRLF
jgi:hypothetical protein